MKAYNEAMEKEERENYEAENTRRLHAKIAMAYKCKAEKFGFVEIEELPVKKCVKRGFAGMDVQPFAINLDGQRVGYYELFLPYYKQAVSKAAKVYINPNHIENYLPTKKIA